MATKEAAIGTLEPNLAPHEWDILGSHELEPQQKNRLYAFRSALSESQGRMQVWDISDWEQVATDPAKSLEAQLIHGFSEQASRSADRMWLSPEYGDLALAGLSHFHVLRSARAETSAHQVFFGVLHDGDPQSEKALPIAVKPCVQKPTKAIFDWISGSLAKAHGERQFPPIGFMLADNVGYSLTRLEASTDTLDNTSWFPVFRRDENNVEFVGQRMVLNQIAGSLGSLHRKRIYHGDPQFKNLAIDLTGDIFFIDWESAAFYGAGAPESELLHKATHDLKVLFSSMALAEGLGGVGLVSGFKYSVQWELFKKYVFDPYMETYLDGVDESSVEFERIGQVEGAIQDYILKGGLYDSMRRRRVQQVG